jgi:WD40 repeat protein
MSLTARESHGPATAACAGQLDAVWQVRNLSARPRCDEHHLNGPSGNPGGVRTITWKPDDSQLVASAGDRTTRLWDVH